MSGVTQKAIDTAIGYLDNMSPALLAFKSARLIENLWTDYQRLSARCERLENELMAIRDIISEGGSFELRELRLKYQSDFEYINPNEPVESA